VDVGNIADVSQVHAASIFRVEVCRVGEFLCIYGLCFERKLREKSGGLIPRPGQQGQCTGKVVNGKEGPF
jgi:hypothetical protein